MDDYGILIVDDEPGVLQGLKRVLRKEGYRIYLAEDGRQGLEMMGTYEVDLVISDYQMPVMDGLAFLAQVKRLYPHVLTIMMTGLEDVKIAVKAINEAGVYKFILKPWGNDELKITVRRALETMALIRERDSLLEKVKVRERLIQELEKEHPGICRVKRDEEGNIIW